MAYASAPQLPNSSKRHPRVCQPESIDKPPTKNPIKVYSARAKHAIFKAASSVRAGGSWQEADGGEGRRRHRQKTHQARQKVVCELEAGGRLRSRQKAHTTQAEGTPRQGERCHTLHTQHDTQLTGEIGRNARHRHTQRNSHTGHSTHNLLMNRYNESNCVRRKTRVFQCGTLSSGHMHSRSSSSGSGGQPSIAPDASVSGTLRTLAQQ